MYTDLIDVDESYPMWKDTGIEPESVAQLLEDIHKPRPAQEIIDLESRWLLLNIQVDQLLVIESIVATILECKGLRGS